MVVRSLAHGGFEAGAGQGYVKAAGMNTPNLAVEVFCYSALRAREEGLGPSFATGDGVGGQAAVGPLAGRLIENLVSKPRSGVTGRMICAAVGDQQGVSIE